VEDRVLDPAAVCVRHKRDGDVARHWAWFSYLTKGADPEVRMRDVHDRHRWHRLGDLMRYRHVYGGVVRCRKRVGLSRSLDRQARRSFGLGGFVSALGAGASTKEALYTEAYLREHEAD
jgi:hypothetical protein